MLSNETIVEVRHLSKSFGNNVVLRDINFRCIAARSCA